MVADTQQSSAHAAHFNSAVYTGNTIIPETAGEQEQDGPTTNRKKTFLEHCEDAMDEHETLGRLPAQ